MQTCLAFQENLAHMTSCTCEPPVCSKSDLHCHLQEMKDNLLRLDRTIRQVINIEEIQQVCHKDTILWDISLLVHLLFVFTG